MESSSVQSSGSYDHSFKIVLMGDAGVGKTSLIATFVSDSIQTPQPIVDMDLKSKLLVVGGKKLMLIIWDTPGQADKFRTLTHSFYRGADGIILVYDITNRSTFTAISDFWVKEVGLYTNDLECVKMLVGNKVDRNSERAVNREEGIALAKELKCSFLECSATTRENVEQCFGTLAPQIMELLEGEEEEKEEEEEEEISPVENLIQLTTGIELNVDVGGGGDRRRGRGRRRVRSQVRGRGRGIRARRVIRGGRGIRSGPVMRGGRC